MVAWNKGLTKETDPRVARISLAVSKALKGREITWAGKMAATKRAQHKPAWNRGLTKESDPRVAKYAQSQANHNRTPEHCQHISEAKKGTIPWMKGKHHTVEAKEKNRLAHLGRQIWTNGRVITWIDKIMRAKDARPNKLEEKLLEILDRHFPNEWVYVGDGSLVLGGKVPDYLNVNGQKQLIELFGDYWHQGEDPQKRIDFFSKYGFETLVLWGHEVCDEALVVAKVKNLKCVEAIQELPEEGKDMVRSYPKG